MIINSEPNKTAKYMTKYYCKTTRELLNDNEYSKRL